MQAKIALAQSQHKSIHAFDAVFLRVTDAFMTYMNRQNYEELAVDTVGLQYNNDFIYLSLRTCM